MIKNFPKNLSEVAPFELSVWLSDCAKAQSYWTAYCSLYLLFWMHQSFFSVFANKNWITARISHLARFLIVLVIVKQSHRIIYEFDCEQMSRWAANKLCKQTEYARYRFPVSFGGNFKMKVTLQTRLVFRNI